MSGEGALNFDTVTLDNVATGATRAFDIMKDAIAPGGATALFVVAILVCGLWAKKEVKSPVTSSLVISCWPRALKAALIPLLLSFILTHIFAAASVYYNTAVASESSTTYFESLGIGRLFSLSHAHLFAHATMYFLMAVLVQLSGKGKLFTLWAPTISLWAGVFDVVAWWGHKKVSPSFEILSALCGSAFSLGFILMTFAILSAASGTQVPVTRSK